MFIFGIIAGISAAFFQDAGYIFSRLYVKRGGTASQLLYGTQILMGGAGLLLLPALLLAFHSEFTFSARIVLPLLGSAYGSLFGQFFFFKAEKNIDPATLSSLMGLRVVLISIFSMIFFGERFNALQITGIFLAAFSAFLLNWRGGKLQSNGMGMLAFSLLAYACSDLSVMHLVRSLAGGKNAAIPAAALLGLCMVNLLLALSVLPGILKAKTLSLRKAAPFSSVWLLKQLLLYLCYAWIGPVFGNVILSLRGPIAMILSAILLKWGVQGLEEELNADWKLRIRKYTASLIMSAAIILYASA